MDILRASSCEQDATVRTDSLYGPEYDFSEENNSMRRETIGRPHFHGATGVLRFRLYSAIKKTDILDF